MEIGKKRGARTRKRVKRGREKGVELTERNKNIETDALKEEKKADAE